ncbi:MAG TPA: hypothetical protein VFF70_07170 [Anaerolineae bacterium]|jgi:hypothetical protein|nr:hypothetical protein [Anaerolineae bacterium]
MSKGGGITIPDNYTIKLGSDGSTIKVDADLDNIHVKELPRIELGDINVHVKEFPTITLNTNVAVTELPEIHAKTDSNVNIAIKEIPDTRVHLPANFNVGLSVLGYQLFNISLCGEAQVISEKYAPRRMEIC